MAFLLDGFWSGTLQDAIINMLPILFFNLLPIIPKLENLAIYNLSFMIYAIHQPLIMDLIGAIRTAFRMVHTPISVSNLLARLIILFMAIMLAGIVYLALSKIAPKFLSLLTGGRQNQDAKLRIKSV